MSKKKRSMAAFHTKPKNLPELFEDDFLTEEEVVEMMSIQDSIDMELGPEIFSIYQSWEEDGENLPIPEDNEEELEF